MVKTFSLDFLRIDPCEIGSFRGEIEYTHTKKNESGTAYPSSEGVGLLLRLPRALGVRNAKIVVYDEACKEQVAQFGAKYVSTDGSTDTYKAQQPRYWVGVIERVTY